MASWRRLWVRTAFCLAIIVAALPAAAEPIPFRRVIELALQRSGAVLIASADQDKAYFTHKEARSAFLPTVILGSGLGYSFGVPQTIEGSAPSIFNVNTTQYVINLAQKDLIRAAQNDLAAAKLDLEDKKNQAVLDAALAYIELDSALARLRTLSEQQQSAERATFITQERVKEGLDSSLDGKRTELSAARVRLRVAEAQTTVDVLRERLAKMTGLTPESIETVTESIPSAPEIRQEQDYASMALANSPAVKVLDQRVSAAEFRARAEGRGTLPSVDLASQYALLSKYNNYEEFYRKFSRNNLSVGFAIRFPILNYAQKARAQAAEADAVRARKEVEGVKAQITEQTLKLQRTLRQLEAATDVARLEYEVAEGSIAGVEARLQSGQSNAREAEQARLDAGDRYLSWLDAQLELQRTRLQLLRNTGEIAEWASSK